MKQATSLMARAELCIAELINNDVVKEVLNQPNDNAFALLGLGFQLRMKLNPEGQDMIVMLATYAVMRYLQDQRRAKADARESVVTA